MSEAVILPPRPRVLGASVTTWLLLAGVMHLVLSFVLYQVSLSGAFPQLSSGRGYWNLAPDSGDTIGHLQRMLEWAREGRWDLIGAAYLPWHVGNAAKFYILSGAIFGANFPGTIPLNTLLYVALLLLVYRIIREFAGPRAAFLGAAWAGLMPSLLFHMTQPLKDPPYVVGQLLILYSMIRLLRGPANTFIAGKYLALALAGFAVSGLVRPHVQFIGTAVWCLGALILLVRCLRHRARWRTFAGVFLLSAVFGHFTMAAYGLSPFAGRFAEWVQRTAAARLPASPPEAAPAESRTAMAEDALPASPVVPEVKFDKNVARMEPPSVRSLSPQVLERLEFDAQSGVFRDRVSGLEVEFISGHLIDPVTGGLVDWEGTPVRIHPSARASGDSALAKALPLDRIPLEHRHRLVYDAQSAQYLDRFTGFAVDIETGYLRNHKGGGWVGWDGGPANPESAARTEVREKREAPLGRVPEMFRHRVVLDAGKRKYVDSETGFEVEFITGWLLDPNSGRLLNWDGQPVPEETQEAYETKAAAHGVIFYDDIAKAYFDRGTGYQIDLKTYRLIDPRTGGLVDWPEGAPPYGHLMSIFRPTNLAERLALMIWKRRQEWVSTSKASSSNLDRDVEFRSTRDLVLFFPRALAIGVASPFPPMWFGEGRLVGQAGRLAAGLEMLILYALLPGVFIGAWRLRRDPAFALLLSYALLGCLFLGLFVVNIGALYRMRFSFSLVLGLLAFAGYAQLRRTACSPAPLRVVRIIARMNVGGPALHTTYLTARLPRERYQSWLLAGEIDAGEANYLAWNAEAQSRLVPVKGLARELHPVKDLAALWRAYRLIRRIRPHIVHTHTAKAGAIGRLAAWLAGVPVILHTYHGHVLQGYFSKPKERLFIGIERALGRISTGLITVSPQVREDLLRRGIGRPEAFHVIPLGIDLERFKACESLQGQMRRELGVPADAPLVTIVARLTAIKRHTDFLSAAKMVAIQAPKARFLIVGDGEERAALERTARELNLSDKVIFTGWRQDLDRIYADSDIVALSSANEGLPVSLIEAMAAGRAVAATAVGGVPDLILGDKGLMVPPADPEALAEAILTLIRDPALRSRLGKAARHDAQRYAVQRLLEDMDQLYTSLVNSSGGKNACIT